VATRKLSVSIDQDLVAEAEHYAGPRGLSRFVNEALRDALEGRRLGQYLDELAEEYGPVDEELVEEYRRQWPEL